MNLGIGTEAALFPEKEYIMEISFAVYKCLYWLYCSSENNMCPKTLGAKLKSQDISGRNISD